ncbi:hypothetical protein FACS189442_0420 [Spirochaetia bacterium]|nr:hypothetical protein FACS189442_0420 [Spirochaetia bacterium]
MKKTINLDKLYPEIDLSIESLDIFDEFEGSPFLSLEMARMDTTMIRDNHKEKTFSTVSWVSWCNCQSTQFRIARRSMRKNSTLLGK